MVIDFIIFIFLSVCFFYDNSSFNCGLVDRLISVEEEMEERLSTPNKIFLPKMDHSVNSGSVGIYLLFLLRI